MRRLIHEDRFAVVFSAFQLRHRLREADDPVGDLIGEDLRCEPAVAQGIAQGERVTADGVPIGEDADHLVNRFDHDRL